MNKHKLITIRCVLIILTLILCGIIFALSADTADESTAISDPVSESFTVSMLKNFNLSEEQAEFIKNYAVVIVRKTAHLSEYALLGFLLASICTSFYKNKKSTLAISQICGSAYAVSDEIHQYFIPGRSCQISDMIIDSFGVLCGIALLFFIVFLYFKIKEQILIVRSDK